MRTQLILTPPISTVFTQHDAHRILYGRNLLHLPLDRGNILEHLLGIVPRSHALHDFQDFVHIYQLHVIPHSIHKCATFATCGLSSTSLAHASTIVSKNITHPLIVPQPLSGSYFSYYSGFISNIARPCAIFGTTSEQSPLSSSFFHSRPVDLRIIVPTFHVIFAQHSPTWTQTSTP